MIKVLQKTGPEGTSINIIKVINDEPTAITIFTREKNQSISIKTKNETGLPTIPTPFQYSAGNTTQSNKAKEGN